MEDGGTDDFVWIPYSVAVKMSRNANITNYTFTALDTSLSLIHILLFGFYQLGFFGKSGAMGKEHRLPFKLDMLAMSPITALIMGFTLSLIHI